MFRDKDAVNYMDKELLVLPVTSSVTLNQLSKTVNLSFHLC